MPGMQYLYMATGDLLTVTGHLEECLERREQNILGELLVTLSLLLLYNTWQAPALNGHLILTCHDIAYSRSIV